MTRSRQVDMVIHRHVAERAQAAFRGELQSLAYAYPDVDLGVLERELRLALYRIAHQGEPVATEDQDVTEVGLARESYVSNGTNGVKAP